MRSERETDYVNTPMIAFLIGVWTAVGVGLCFAIGHYLVGGNCP